MFGNNRNRNCVHKDTKSRLNLGNVCNHSVQSFSSCFLSKSLKIKIYKIIVLPVLYGCETWSLALKQEHRGCRRLHNEVLHNLFASPNVVRVIKLKRMRWT
jgi:hypothetical protein